MTVIVIISSYSSKLSRLCQEQGLDWAAQHHPHIPLKNVREIVDIQSENVIEMRGAT